MKMLWLVLIAVTLLLAQIPEGIPGGGSGGVAGTCGGLSGDLSGTCSAGVVSKLSLATASQVIVVDASKNVTSLPYGTASAATSIVERDANQNAFANNFVSKAATVVSAGATTTLTAASARLQQLTGSMDQTFQLPDATTLAAGSVWYFTNNSTGTMTINNATPALQTTIPAGGAGWIVLLVASPAAGVWDWHFFIPGNASWGTAGVTAPAYSTSTNCSSSASPAVCGSAASGSFVLAAAATTVTVNTTAVTANSQIFIQDDASLGTKLGVTCNTTPPSAIQVSARVAATSFTIIATAPSMDGACMSFFLLN